MLPSRLRDRAPGLSNLILGRMEEHLDETASFHCLVGRASGRADLAVGVQGALFAG